MDEKRRKSFVNKVKKLISLSKERNRAKQITEPNSQRTSAQSISTKKLTKPSPSPAFTRRLHRAKVSDEKLHTKQSRKQSKRVNNENQNIAKVKKSPKTIKSKAHESKFTLDEKQKETFVNFINEIYDLGVNGLVQQFVDQVSTYKPNNDQCDAFKRNPKRNRYKCIQCLDNTRVILKQEQDYIHANYVTSKYLLNQFICTQAPMKSTVNDFWIMIMQENVRYIIMLCNLVESGKKKCHTYYPTEVGSKIKFNEITISNVNVDLRDSKTIISQLKVEKNDRALFVSHVLWNDWPDHGVPSSELAPFQILKMVRRSRKRPTVIHCSAGVGRTGTIIAIEMGLEQLLHCVPLHLVELCKELRNMRAFSVQTDLQYVYIAKCLLAYAWCCGIFINIPNLIPKSDSFDKKYKELMESQQYLKAVEESPSGLIANQMTGTVNKKSKSDGKRKELINSHGSD
ncbi:Protein-tyrosine phosphatase family protein [Brugia pahangi]